MRTDRSCKCHMEFKSKLVMWIKFTKYSLDHDYNQLPKVHLEILSWSANSEEMNLLDMENNHTCRRSCGEFCFRTCLLSAVKIWNFLDHYTIIPFFLIKSSSSAILIFRPIRDVLWECSQARFFQWHRSQAQIRLESMGIFETIGHLESVMVLRHNLLGCWPMYRVGVHYGHG